MIFGPTLLADARGAVLAHTQRLPGRVLKKGVVLDEAAIAALAEAGMASVIAARIEPGDVGEDEAATRLAAALVAPDLDATRAATGRVNLSARAHGLLRLDVAALNALNAVDESLTVATLPDWAPVGPGDMVATIKTIPFAVAGAVLARAEALAAGAACFRLHRFRPLKVGLVLSTLPGLKPSILEGTVRATRQRVEGLSGSLLAARVCAHDSGAIATELAGLIGEGADILLVAGASAVVDRRDIGPEGIVAAGGAILHFGMPVDPGNLICLGRIGERPALVLPGCARSPKLNGIDWVLARIFAGIGVTGADIARMGVGGLLKDFSARPLPRAKATPRAEAPRRPKIAALVLAAGRSSRMAPHNKLLVPVGNGETMIGRVVSHVLASQARPVLVVTGHQEEQLRAALAGREVTFVRAEHFAAGLAESLKSGIAAVPADCAAALVCLGDMPLVSPAALDRLIAAYDPDEGRPIVLPSFHGRQGNPVLWDRRFFAEIAALSGDSGARALLAAHQDLVAEVEMGDDAVLRDFDTVETLGEFAPR